MILVVGAGFAGSVIARKLADHGYKVRVIDKRDHVGGNAYDKYDEHGVLIHSYGPHIFHTNSERIFNFLTRFTSWYMYEHRVLSYVEGNLYPFPINRDTVNMLYSKNFSEAEVEEYFESVREQHYPAATSEDVVLNSVGRDLYEKFFLNYTIKQWGIPPSELKAGVAARIPVRTNQDDRYFTDTFQGLPEQGYTAMFLNMLQHPNITVELNTEFSSNEVENFDHVFYTGPIDAFFNYSYGRLPYRSLRFDHHHIEHTEKFQQVGTVNYPNDYNYTRITEFKHLTGQECKGTSIVFEYPEPCSSDMEPYYPIPNQESEEKFKQYKELSKDLTNVTFVGRLAQYRYYNMDQVVGAALTAADAFLLGEAV